MVKIFLNLFKQKALGKLSFISFIASISILLSSNSAYALYPDPPFKAFIMGATVPEPLPMLTSEKRIGLLEKADLLKDLAAEKPHVFNNFDGVVLVAQHGYVLYAESFGNANHQTNEKNTLETCFQLASVSKTFTGVATLQLWEKGLLDIDLPVKDYIVDFPYANITTRQLLNHRSGLADYIGLAESKHRGGLMSNEEMHTMMVRYKPKLKFTPGTKFSYSNTGYAYLALLVERISGQPFDEYLTQNIFLPANMLATYVLNHKNTDIPFSAVGYKGGNKYPQPRAQTTNGVMGDKGVYSCAGDMLAYDIALYSGKLINETTLAMAFTGGSPESCYESFNYGFGFRVKACSVGTIVYHNGWWRGFKSIFRHYLEEDIILIVLSNSDRKITVAAELEQWLMGQNFVYSEEVE